MHYRVAATESATVAGSACGLKRTSPGWQHFVSYAAGFAARCAGLSSTGCSSGAAEFGTLTEAGPCAIESCCKCH